MKYITELFLALVAFFSPAVYATDTYNPANSQLTIPSVVLGDTVYKNVIITVGPILTVGGSNQDLKYPAKPSTTPDTYDPYKNQLTIPSVSAYGFVYYDVVINVGVVLSVGSSEPLAKPTIAVQKTSYLNAKNLNIPAQKIPTYAITNTYREDAFAGIAYGDFLQDGTISLVTFTNWNWTDRSLPWRAGSVYFYKYVNGEPVDVTAKLLKDRTGCMAPRKVIVADLSLIHISEPTRQVR
jgi:hypothetical protein